MDEHQKIELLRIITDKNNENQRKNLRHLNDIIQIIQFIRYKAKNAYFKSRLHDSNLLYQKAYLHGLSIYQLSKGISIDIPSHSIKANINDPISISILERGLLETYLTFFHINFSNHDEIRNISYASWIIHGLKQRQKIEIRKENNPFRELQEKKKDEELKEIERNIIFLNETKTFSQLTDQQRDNYIKGLKKNWKYEYTEYKFKPIGYQDILNRLGIRYDLLKDLYNHLSWSAHSTSVGISQIADLWNKERADLLFLNNALIYTCTFLALMSRDIITNDPDFKVGYDILSQDHKDLLNFYNYYFRGDDFILKNID